jgi:hypothetical protein
MSTSTGGEDVAVAPGTPPQTQGLWLVPSTGGSSRRLLLPPRSVEGNQLGIGPVAWSPDRYTLAYAVNPAGGGHERVAPGACARHLAHALRSRAPAIVTVRGHRQEE